MLPGPLLEGQETRFVPEKVASFNSPVPATWALGSGMGTRELPEAN